MEEFDPARMADLEDVTVGNETILEDFEVLDFRGAVNIISYTVMSAVGIILNSAVLIIAGQQSRRADMVSRTNVHFLVFHLTLADAIISFITMPMETVWRLVIEWHAGNVACKVLMMIRTGGYILSSLMLVVLSVDRYISISQPFSSLNITKQRRRAKLMVVGAWMVTLVLASPQAVIFRVLKHPDKNFYQCTTVGFWEGLASPVNITVNGSLQSVDRLWGLRPIYWSDIYHTAYNCEIFLLPLVIIVATYIRIYAILTRRIRHISALGQVRVTVRKSSEDSRTSAGSQALNRPSQCSSACLQLSPSRRNDSDGGALPKPAHNNKPQRTVMKALKMSVIHVLAFIISWTPYTIMGTWDTIDRVFGYNAADGVPVLARDVLYLTAVLNSCINPIIYGVYYFSERAKQTTNSRRISRNSASPYKTTHTNMLSRASAQTSFIHFKKRDSNHGKEEDFEFHINKEVDTCVTEF